MKLKNILSVFLLFVAAQVSAYKEQSIDIKVGTQNRNMICYTPSTTKANMPLFIVTHGMNQNPEYQRDGDKLYELIDTAKFVVAYLRSDGNTWDIGGQKDLNFVKQTITEMNTRFGIDKGRVYWAGFSMGSMLIYHGIENGMGDVITAFAPCSGVKFSEPWNNCKKPINLIHCHSKYDEVFPIDQYKPRDYAAHFSTVDKCTDYKKTSGVSLPGGWDKGDKERWWNGTNGSEVEIFMCNGGGHWPTANYAREIWAFCKRFSKSTPLQTYENVCKEAATMLQQWEGDITIFTALKTNYNNLKKAYDTYGPEQVNKEDEAAVKTATNKLNSAISSFSNTATNTTKTSKRVTKTEFDPNFHIYLCFGQSNMEGNATPELEDYSGSSTRFLMMAPVKMSTYNRMKGYWYVARPPLCRDWTGLTPADYFGKTMIKNLPDSITVGVINVALGGCAIEMFNEDGIADYIKKQADWLQGYAKEYSNNPFRYLVDRAKEAQKVGVIKGILLHQGCSNNGQQDWPDKVNLIYTRLLKELNLSQDEVPLLVGELLQQNQGGVCWGHNSVVAKVPSVIRNAHVVSSAGCPGASDGLHFTAKGYRMIGENYAEVMLKAQARFMKNYDYGISELKSQDATFSMAAASTRPLYIWLTDKEGVKHDVTASCEFSCDKPELVSFKGVNAISTNVEGDATITASYTNKDGETISTSFQVSVRLFPLETGTFNPSILQKGTFTTSSISGVGTFKSVKGGLGGWLYNSPVDLSDYKFLTVDLKSVSLAKPVLRIYDVKDPESASYYSFTMTGLKQAVVDLHNMTDADGNKIDPSHIYIVALNTQSNSSVMIQSVTVSKEDPTGILLNKADESAIETLYDLSGRRVNEAKRGLYIKNGKKILVR